MAITNNNPIWVKRSCQSVVNQITLWNLGDSPFPTVCVWGGSVVHSHTWLYMSPVCWALIQSRFSALIRVTLHDIYSLIKVNHVCTILGFILFLMPLFIANVALAATTVPAIKSPTTAWYRTMVGVYSKTEPERGHQQPWALITEQLSASICSEWRSMAVTKNYYYKAVLGQTGAPGWSKMIQCHHFGLCFSILLDTVRP